jgi:hypothetical protein
VTTIVVTNGGAGYDGVNHPNIACPNDSAVTTATVYTIRCGERSNNGQIHACQGW